MKLIKVTGRDALQYIYEQGFVSAFELVDQFGLSPSGARWKLTWLKKKGLIVNETKGLYTITDKGIGKLIHLKRIQR